MGRILGHEGYTMLLNLKISDHGGIWQNSYKTRPVRGSIPLSRLNTSNIAYDYSDNRILLKNSWVQIVTLVTP